MKQAVKRVWALGVALCSATIFCAGLGLAASYEVRMPVEKTARIAPLGAVSDAEAKDAAADKASKPAKPPKMDKSAAHVAPAAPDESAKPAKPETAVKPEKPVKPEPAAKPEPADKAEHADKADKAPKSAKPAKPTKIDALAKPQAPAAHVAPAAPDSKAAAPAESAAPAPAAPAKQAPKAAAKPAPKPAPPAPPAPKVDPKALEMPPVPVAQRVPTALPGSGQWAADLELEFQPDRILLHVATNAAVDRLTWFNQSEPRKLALDLRGQWRLKGARVLRFDAGPVKNVLVGEHPDRLRLAVEFRDGAVVPVVTPEVAADPKGGVTVIIPLAVRLR